MRHAGPCGCLEELGRCPLSAVYLRVSISPSKHLQVPPRRPCGFARSQELQSYLYLSRCTPLHIALLCPPPACSLYR
jgi:hypothetical protein